MDKEFMSVRVSRLSVMYRKQINLRLLDTKFILNLTRSDNATIKLYSQ
jgi:hypothetical protein